MSGLQRADAYTGKGKQKAGEPPRLRYQVTGFITAVTNGTWPPSKHLLSPAPRTTYSTRGTTSSTDEGFAKGRCVYGAATNRSKTQSKAVGRRPATTQA
eukprot:3585120-Karenia_brevis.AAC.1